MINVNDYDKDHERKACHHRSFMHENYSQSSTFSAVVVFAVVLFLLCDNCVSLHIVIAITIHIPNVQKNTNHMNSQLECDLCNRFTSTMFQKFLSDSSFPPMQSSDHKWIFAHCCQMSSHSFIQALSMHSASSSPLLLKGVLGQNGSGQNGTDKMVYGQNVIGQNGTDKLVRIERCR